MIQNKEDKYIINNYYYITFDDLSKFQEFSKLFQQFTDNNSGIKSFLNSNIKKNNKNVILNKDEELTKNFNTEVKKEESNIFEENGKNVKNYLDENKENLTIEIPKLEKNFLNKKRMFKINRKKRGRQSKNLNSKSDHTKYSHDNISRKIKVKFFQKFMKYINGKINSKYNGIIQKLLPLKGEICQNNAIKFNIQLLNTKLKDLFSTTEINIKKITTKML